MLAEIIIFNKMIKNFEQISPREEKKLKSELTEEQKESPEGIFSKIRPCNEKLTTNEINNAENNIQEGILLGKKGEPLILYRGSDLSLDQEVRYSKEHLGHSTEAPSAGEAFFFSDRKSTADYYSRGSNANKESSVRRGGDPHIDKVNLVMRRPFIHDFKGKFYRGDETTYYNLIKKAKEEGYDGVIFEDTYDGGEYGRLDAVMKGRFTSETIYGVFEPDQIILVGREETISSRKKRAINKKG